MAIIATQRELTRPVSTDVRFGNAME